MVKFVYIIYDSRTFYKPDLVAVYSNYNSALKKCKNLASNWRRTSNGNWAYGEAHIRKISDGYEGYIDSDSNNKIYWYVEKEELHET